MTLKKIGEFIKKRRVSLGLRQEDLSEISEVAIKTLHHIEQGTGNPSFETLDKVADVLGLEIELKVKNLG